ncbi:MAG: hypothetical protein MUO54_01240 [Anaerolineales bacterium]|nr:hypothetical protein [Anaerolineales bacterium]
MSKIFKEIKDDASFIRSHSLQPQWYKILKVFLILGFLGAHLFFFGSRKTLIFSGLFFTLSLVVHMLYRIKTEKFTMSWLDFVVTEKNGELEYERIGIYYYSLVFFNIVLSLLVAHRVF